MNKKYFYISVFSLIIFIFSFSLIMVDKNYSQISIQTSANATQLSNKKIGWGIKREDNHAQPDLGKQNKELINKYEGYCLGNSDKKNIYLTFDEGYEAGYTPKLLDTLKQNNVKAAFFLTAHYLNTNEDLVKRMIDEGHTIGNHTPKSLMSDNLKLEKV